MTNAHAGALIQYLKELECTDHEVQQPLQPDDRGELKVIVKIFICAPQQPPEVILEAIDKGRSDLSMCVHDIAETAYWHKMAPLMVVILDFQTSRFNK